MWIKTKERMPEKDGFYLVTMVYGGGVTGLSYTTGGGWNTFIDYKGNLCAESAIEPEMVSQWFDHPEPEAA